MAYSLTSLNTQLQISTRALLSRAGGITANAGHPLFSPHLCYAAIYSMEVSVFSDREIFCVSRGNAGDVAVVNCLFAPMCRGGQTPPFPQPRRLSGVAVVTVCHA